MYQIDTLKKLTSNKDRIRAQRKGEKAFNFVNFAKPIFGAIICRPVKMTHLDFIEGLK
jgi:hypothetical protein